MGLGLGSNLGSASLPHPWRVHEARREAPIFAELEARRPALGALFHPVHLNLYGPALEPPAALAALDAHARAIGSPWVSNDVAWWHVGGRPFPGHRYLAPPFSRADRKSVV